MNEHQQSEINKNIRIRGSVAVWAMGIIAAGAIEWADLRHEVQNKVDRKDADHWIFEFQQMNPAVKVPELKSVATVSSNSQLMATALKGP